MKTFIAIFFCVGLTAGILASQPGCQPSRKPTPAPAAPMPVAPAPKLPIVLAPKRIEGTTLGDITGYRPPARQQRPDNLIRRRPGKWRQ